MTYPSKVNLCSLAALSSALVQVGPGVGFAPLFVPSHMWVPPEAVVTLWPRVKTVPSKIVFSAPSIRKLTRVRSFAADAAHERKKSPNKLEYKRRNIILQSTSRGYFARMFSHFTSNWKFLISLGIKYRPQIPCSPCSTLGFRDESDDSNRN